MNNFYKSSIVKSVKIKLQTIYNNQFVKDLFNDEKSNGEGNKLRTYRLYKSENQLEPYLSIISNPDIRQNLARLRISAHNLPIEKGRHRRNGKVPLKERTCDMCFDNEIGDEYHMMIKCNRLAPDREKLFTNLTEIFPDFLNMGDNDKFIFLMTCNDTDLARTLEKFLETVISVRGPF